MAFFAFVFISAFAVSYVSGYDVLDWQYWAALLPILISGFIFGTIKDDERKNVELITEDKKTGKIRSD